MVSRTMAPDDSPKSGAQGDTAVRRCPECRKRMELSLKQKGRVIVCTRCKALLAVSVDPWALTLVGGGDNEKASKPATVPCPSCDSELRLVAELDGRQIRCNTCRAVLAVSATRGNSRWFPNCLGATRPFRAGCGSGRVSRPSSPTQRPRPSPRTRRAARKKRRRSQNDAAVCQPSAARASRPRAGPRPTGARAARSLARDARCGPHPKRTAAKRSAKRPYRARGSCPFG